jgi:hypothetical protein
MAQANDFDFKGFSAMTDRVPAGLQIYLAQQLLANALWSFDRFDNPRADDVRGVLGDVLALRTLLKDDAKAREAAKS